MKKGKKSKRLPSLKSLRGRAHGLWSRIVRLQNPICTVCAEKPSSQAHHVLSKRFYSALRFSPAIGVGVCSRCHIEVHASPALQALSLSQSEAERIRVLVREYQPMQWTRARLMLVISGLETILYNTKTRKEAAA